MARRSRVLSETLSGARVLTAAEVTDNYILAIDPGGAARNIDLPATSADLAGQEFVLINTADAAESITLRLTGGGATVATIDQNEHATVICHSATAGSWVAAVSKNT